MTDDDLAAVVEREQQLLDPACRANEACLRGLLHPNFREHGASGTVWTLDSVVSALPTTPDPGVHAADFQAHRLAEGVILVTYRTEGTRGALRSSVWIKNSRGHWQLRFHQGTRADT